MTEDRAGARGPRPATLLVTSPSGVRTRVPVDRVPFRIGRLGANDLVLRDSRASRRHAEIRADASGYFIRDLGSTYGVTVNGERVESAPLRSGDRIEFGFADSYSVVFTLADETVPPAAEPALTGGAGLQKLRATLEVARALQTSLSTDEVLRTVVDAALAVTGCERGFLLLCRNGGLDTRVARSRSGELSPSDLRVPARMLLRALKERRDFLSMSFDPERTECGGQTIADLELRSVVCVPLVRVRTGSVEETAALTPGNDTVGLLYMDSRVNRADLSAGGRELLTTLALEASTVLENARLLEELWARQRYEQELKIARDIQESLLPRALPAEGWFRAAGSSAPSWQVGGDCFDIRQTSQTTWAALVADVSGKGVGAALLSSLLEGMFLAAPASCLTLEEGVRRVNAFLNERTAGEQYATVFYCTVERGGRIQWINAGHPPALLAHCNGHVEKLPATGVPIGLFEDAVIRPQSAVLQPGDRLVIYTDGVTEAMNGARETFGIRRLQEVVARAQGASARELHDRILAALDAFTGGAEQHDDVTLAVIEYRPD